MNTALIIQQVLSTDKFTNEYRDMMRLIYQRHAAYAGAHGFDYWHILGDYAPEFNRWRGGWDKLQLIGDALAKGWEFIAWIDSDAAITGDVDLREALPEGKLIGACEHYAPWFEASQIPRHFNIGVTYWRNNPITRKFIAEWIASYPGDKRWG